MYESFLIVPDMYFITKKHVVIRTVIAKSYMYKRMLSIY